MVNNTRFERRDAYQTGACKKEGGEKKITFIEHLSHAGFYTRHFHVY